MARINLYAQDRHTVIVDGVMLSGFSEGDHIEVDVEGNAAARSLGGDGPAMNLSVKQGGKISVSLLPTSPALGQMYGIRDVQALTPRMFTVSVMTGVEEVITASGCGFGKLPAFTTGGEKMQPRKFDIECLVINMDISAVEAIAGSFFGS